MCAHLAELLCTQQDDRTDADFAFCAFLEVVIRYTSENHRTRSNQIASLKMLHDQTTETNCAN